MVRVLTELLSARAREAIKTGLAMTIAYGIALGMGWDNPSWAGFAVAMISLSTAGQSLNKGVMRMLGTFMAAGVALTLIALFAQERWWFMIALSAYLGFCTYMLTGKTFQYFWYVSAFVCLIVAVDGGASAEGAFQAAMMRIQETGLGILVYSLVSVFLWPQRSGEELKAVARQLFETQRRILQAYGGSIGAPRTEEGARALRMQQLQLLNQFRATLAGAEADTREVWEARRRWKVFDDLVTNLGETLERWRATFPEIQVFDLWTLMPNLQAVLSETDDCLERIERMLAGRTSSKACRVIELELDGAKLQSLNHLQRAAVVSFKTELEGVESLSKALFACVADIKVVKGKGGTRFETAPAECRRQPFSFDPDRLLAVVQVVTTVWIAFLIWIYLNPPGHAGFVQLAASVAMAAAMMAQARVISMVLPFAVGSVLAGLLYVFVMPHLSGYGELGILIFAVTFAIYYLFGEPRQALAKLACIVPFLIFTSIQNEQTYSFAGFLNSLAMLMLGLFLVAAVSYLPPSPRPERVFLRLLKRFFRHAELRLSRLGPDVGQDSDWRRRLKEAFYRGDLTDVPDKLALYARQIDHRISPDTSAEQIQQIVDGTRILAHRIRMLEDAGRYPQADRLDEELRDDIRAWRLAVQAECRSMAGDVEEAARLSTDSPHRLTARMQRLETRIAEVLARSGGDLSSTDYENFYRYLGGLRGVSEAGIEYAQLAGTVNWGQLREARF